MFLEHVLLFSNPYQGGSRTSTIIRNITSLSSQIAYSEHVQANITTLSSNYAATQDGVIQGLLYVPDLNENDACQSLLDEYVPKNVTRQASLPPTDYNLIAVAPWISVDCTKAYLDAVRVDPLRGFIFYLPDSGATPPPPVEDVAWELNDEGAWKTTHHYPVYAVSGASGTEMMRQLSLYSGNITSAPYGSDIESIYHADHDDYVRVWTELHVSSRPTVALWIYVLIIVGLLLFVVGSTSMAMHYYQRRRRSRLRRRVMHGELDLEALGIKRVTVPLEHIHLFPLFTYNYDPPVSPSKAPSSPSSLNPSIRKASVLEKYDPPMNYQPVCHICLEDYVSKFTIIRELPCGHIFHPECIDEFLNEVSSLCPICRQSMLPKGYCPKITNGMMRREMATRKLRPVVVSNLDSPRPRTQSWSSTGQKRSRLGSGPSSPAPQTEAIELPERIKQVTKKDATTARQQRMRELAGSVFDGNSDDGKPQWKLAVSKVFPGFN